MNTAYRKFLPGTRLDYFDARAAIEAIRPGAYDGLPYVARVLAEQLVRRCDPAMLTDALVQIIEGRRDMDFPWYPARVVCHDILGQTALVDLAGLRDAIADQGGDPAKVNPVVPTQLSSSITPWRWNTAASIRRPSPRTGQWKTAAMKTASISSNGPSGPSRMWM